MSAFRPWVTGAVDDAVLGATRISATGAEVAPGLTAVALAIAAAAIAIVAAGRIARLVAVVGVCRVRRHRRRARRARAPRPRGRARTGRRLAGGPHRLGRDRRRAHRLALGRAASPAVVALVGLAGAVVGMRRWGGPSQRYEVPERRRPPTSAGPRGERVASDWDELSAGRDPTDVGPDAPDLTESTGEPTGHRPLPEELTV